MQPTARITRSARTDEHFPDPFMDMASLYTPDNIADVLRWSEFILSINGPYRQAVERIVSYFLTDVEIGDGSQSERERWGDFFDEQLGLKAAIKLADLDYFCYGNGFRSILVPFRRYLVCKKCKLDMPFRKLANTPEFKFRWRNFEFHATCARCHYSGVWEHIDRRSDAVDELRIKRWSPHQIELLWDPLTEDVRYIWKIPEDYRNQIRRGDLFQLERASWEVVQAVKHNQHLLFDKDIVYHFKEDTFAGIQNRGWGIPRTITNFRQAWYVQVLHRYNEAIALDYVIPFRVLTPMPQPGANAAGAMDPVRMTSLGSFVGRVNTMLKRRRRDPGAWNVLPFPLQYQALGGDARTLAPHELLSLGVETLLDSIGTPMELYKGTLSTQAMPAALRLFESNFAPLVYMNNRFIAWVVRRVASIMSWEPLKVKLERVTTADDINRQMAKLQLMMGRQISQRTGLRSLGLDFAEEQKQMLDEERFAAEEAGKMQTEMEESAATMQQMSGGGMAGGGMPPGAGGAAGGAAMQFGGAMPTQPNVPITPEEVEQKAQTTAQQLMSMPESAKDSALIQLKRTDPLLHSRVRIIMDDARQQAQSVGGAAVMQQQFGKTGAKHANRPVRSVLS